MISKDREYRNFSIDTNEQGAIIEGYAVVFNELTVMYEDEQGIKYYEKIDKNALTKTDITDVVLNIDHAGKPLARTKNKTLSLTIDNKGLFIRAELKSEEGKRLYEEVKQGLFDEMSFAFTVNDEEFDRTTRTRTIKDIKKLYDVSVCTRGAYSQTSIIARSYYEQQAQKEADTQRLELLKRKYKYIS